jgi:hypothetical protein
LPLVFLKTGLEEESPASPFAGDSIAEILNSLSDFPPDLAYRRLNGSFKPFLLSSIFQVPIARKLTKMFFRFADNLFPFAFDFVFVSHYFHPSFELPLI